MKRWKRWMMVSLLAVAGIWATGCDSDTGGSASPADGGALASPEPDTSVEDAAAPDSGAVAQPDVQAADTGSASADPEDIQQAEPEDVATEPDIPARPPVAADPYSDPNVTCPPEGPYEGTVGNTMPDVVLKRCGDSKKFSIWELCGAQAYWIFQTAGWCPHCANTAWTLQNIPERYYEDGVWIIVAVMQDMQRYIASSSYCKKYAEQYKIPTDHILMVIDPSQTSKAFNKTGGVPFHVIMDRRMKILYTWSGGDDSNQALSYIDGILDAQAKEDGKPFDH